jgi:outer membrane protein TolC
MNCVPHTATALGIGACAVLLLTAAPTAAVTLDHCVTTALAGHPDAAAALARIDAATAAIQASRATLRPTVTASAGYTLTDNPPQAFFQQLNQRAFSLEDDFNNPDDTENLRLTLAARWLLLDGGQRRLSTGIAALDAEAAAAHAEAIRQELVYQVTRAYHGVRQARERLTQHEATLNRVEAAERLAAQRVEAGSALRSDQLHLAAQRAEAEDQVVRARHAIHLALAALNTAVGTPVATSDTALNMDNAAPPPPPGPVPEDDAITQRPEWIASERNREARAREVTRARRENLPRLSAMGSTDWDSEVSTDFEQSYLIGVVAEWDLFTGGQRAAQTALAEARQREADARRDALALRLAFEHEQAILAAREAHARIAVAVQAETSASEARRITAARYAEGAATIVELLTAEAALTAANSRLLEASHEYRIALARYDRTRGALPTGLTTIGDAP